MAGDTGGSYARFGDFRLDLQRGRLLRHGEPVAVPPRALDVLVALVRHRDRVVSKAELLDTVWADANVEEANLAQQVFTLRRLLGDDTDQPRLIATLPRRGYRFIADVLEEPAAGNGDSSQPIGSSSPIPASSARHRARPGGQFRPIWWTVAVASIAVAAGSALLTRDAGPGPAPRPVNFQVSLPPGVRLLPGRGLPGISPDARLVALVAERSDARPMIFLRPLDSTRVTPVAGTENALAPFWSPDGRRLGFFADGKLRTVPIEGGAVGDVCDAVDQRGGTWGADGTIVFAAGSRSVLYRVPATGGSPVAVTSLDPARRDISHRFPSFLPDGRRFLFQVWSGDVGRQGIYLGEIGQDAIRRIAAEPSPAVWSDGVLVFVHREALVAQRFDLRTLAPTGEISTVASPVARGPGDEAAFSAARGGIAYVTSRFEARLVWFDRTGRRLGQFAGPGQYESPAISPDGRRVLYSRRDRARGVENLDVWLSDVDGHDQTRVTFDGSVDVESTWSPDGREVIFRSNRSGFSDLYRRRLDANVPETLLLASKARKDVSDWSPDGTSVAFWVDTPGSDDDIWTLPIDRPGQAAPLVDGPRNQSHARFSPDGRLVAYQSDENGLVEVFVQSLGPSRRRWRITSGVQPLWRTDGRELVFVHGGSIAAVPVQGVGDATTFGQVQRLFDVVLGGVVRQAYTMTPDAQRFLVIEPIGHDVPPELHVMLDPPF